MEKTPVSIASLEEKQGLAPLGIIVPGKWAWPTERTIISNAYGHFSTWGQEPIEAVRATISNWYEYPTNKVVTDVQ